MNKRLLITDFLAMKESAEKLTMLTAYDFTTARLLDDAGVDALLVGDSLACVVQGKDTTLAVTLEHTLYHSEMVVRGSTRALVIADMPL